MRVHDSQAYRKMDVTRERIGRFFELQINNFSRCSLALHRVKINDSGLNGTQCYYQSELNRGELTRARAERADRDVTGRSTTVVSVWINNG